MTLMSALSPRLVSLVETTIKQAVESYFYKSDSPGL